MAPKMSFVSFRASKEKGQYSGEFHLGKKKGRASSALVQQGGMKAQNRFHDAEISAVRMSIKRKMPQMQHTRYAKIAWLVFIEITHHFAARDDNQ